MHEGPITFRVARALGAGALAAARWLAVLVVLVAVAVPVVRIGADWYVRGTLEILPPPEAAPSRDMRLLAIRGASATEAAAIRSAVAGLRYKLDPHAVSVVIVDDNPFYTGVAAEYLPYLGIIRLDRRIADAGGVELGWTMAHEVGHYVDQRYMTDAARARFEQLRGIPPRTGWTGQSLPWQERPDEDFAEAFAALSVPSAVVPIGTAYGPVRHPAELRALLQGVGVTFGAEQPPTGWRDAAAREYRLLFDTLSDPAVLWPTVALVTMYLLLGAVPAAMTSWRRSASWEGIPLERGAMDSGTARVLNTPRRVSHRGRSTHATHQGRRHGRRRQRFPRLPGRVP